ncbi:transcriptional regulator, Crp/Fnr family [Thraustotheca clavata]|uniref:Transcriptional regulator, Crp/Fnr family n=1 Tax=Thraustotheca clavata TaxID=74557 RepID=A0A1V9ZD84_9STRA|nr:transcriptional regulator, Crp/Fnr family [Thraustotheca clavata]
MALRRLSGLGFSLKIRPVRGPEVTEGTSRQSSLQNPEKARGILYPTSPYQTAWDMVNILLLLYVCTMVPFVASFYTLSEYQSSPWAISDSMVDTLYLFDILLRFRSAYVDAKSGDLITNPKTIAMHYLKGWFFFDFLVTFPWDTLFNQFEVTESKASQIPRLFRMIRFTRMAKVLRILRIQNLADFCEDKLNINRNYIVVSKLLLSILLVAHFTACGFYTMCGIADSDYEIGMINGDPSRSWIAYATYSKKTWKTTYSRSEMYISSLYFAFTMMATVGFGDFIPITINERIYTIFGMVVSAGTYAFMIASVSSSVASMNVTRNRYFERLNELNAYMESRGLPQSLQLRTRKYYRYFLQKKTVYDESRILEDLSTSLREEITEHYIRMTIKNITFFKDVPKGFTAFIAVHLKPLFVSPLSTVIKMGDYGTEMFIISRGVLQVFEPGHATEEEVPDIEISFLMDGDHFGEMALLLQEQKFKRSASVKAKIYCELHAIAYQHVQMGLTRFPSVMDKLMSAALQRKTLLTNLRKSKVSQLTSNAHRINS